MADKDQTDVVAIPTELSVKHPLQNQWVLWFDNPVKRLGKDWSSNLKKVHAFLQSRPDLPCRSRNADAAAAVACECGA